MKSRRYHRGALLIELMFSGLMAVVIGCALVMMFSMTYTNRTDVNGQNTTYAGVRQVMDTLVDHLRNAQSYNNSGTYNVMSAATASSITIYTDTTGNNTARYYLSNSALMEDVTSSGTTTTSTLLSGVSALTFTYYTDSGAGYAAPSSSWATTANPNAPTSSEMPNVGAIQISTTVNINGYSRQLTSFIRLRNNPYKTKV